MKRDSRQVLTEWLVLAAQGGGETAFTDLHGLWREDLRRLALVRVERPEAADELMPTPTAPAEPPDDVLRLRAAIARLPADQRELLHLYYELGRSVCEIAEVLAIPPGTVKSRLFSVRETLKRQLERNLP